jgi:hypothetical protein
MNLIKNALKQSEAIVNLKPDKNKIGLNEGAGRPPGSTAELYHLLTRITQRVETILHPMTVKGL